MKPTEAQIEEQLEWERHAKAQGLSRLHQQTSRLECQDYASASIYGIASIDTIMPRVIAEIERTVEYHVKRGCNGVAYKEIAHYLADIEAMACAAIALKVIFDKVFSIKDEANWYANICDAIGTAVEQECQMRWYEREVPGLLHKLKEIYWHESKGTPQKFSVMRLMMNRNGIIWHRWQRDVKVRLGGWLLDCVCNVSGWFEPFNMMQHGKRQKVILPSAAFMDAKDQIMANAEMFAPLAWPMLVPPRDWSNEKAGGYYLNEIMLGHDMVRRGRPCIQGETPIEFLNKIQGVAYRLNPFVVDVAEALFERGYKVGKFIPIVEVPLPPKPVDIADNKEARQGYKRDAAHVMDKNAQAFKKSCRTRMTMDAVSKYKDRERFYLPWSFDYRGRAYPIPAFLTPQDTDFGKSLLQFADAAFITNDCVEWIKFQVATTFGLDKAPITERLDWVDNNESLITRVATDPIGNIGDWEGVEEPWLFLAACEEYYYTCIVCTRQSTRLPIAVDATCSGVQILAGLARDASAARLVNVLPGDRPQDAYREVAEVAIPNIPERLQPHTDRKVTKRTVMTLPYNSKPHSNRKYIREAYDEKDECDPPITKEELTQVVSAVRGAMREVLPGVMDVMEWIEREVGIIIRGGADHLEWVTPSGFVVYQKLNKKEVETMKLQLLGRCQISVATGDTDEVNLQKHKNTTSPNLIHSLDASLLHLATLKFDAPIALIHDSVLCRATDMGCLSYLIRETYMYMFAEHDYLRDWAKQVGATTEPPIIDTLEPESVIESTYFFC
jgi:DNA-directed RNA polymerase